MSSFLLLVDSDPDLLALHRRFFIERGHRVEIAASERACLAQLRRHSPDVVVLERELPGDGAESVLARLRTDDDLSQIPVILLSTSAFAEPELVLPPVVACLIKPFRLQALVEVVDSADQRLRDCPAGAER